MDVEVVGCWRRPKTAEAQGTAPREDAERLLPEPTDDGVKTSTELLHEVHEMTELAPPVVTRVAVTLGIAPLTARGASTLGSLGRETGVAPPRLSPLLNAITALGLVERDGDHYRNTARGGVLMEDAVIEEFSLDNPANREALALVDLLDVARSGHASPRLGTSTWRERRAADQALDFAHQDRAADQLQFVVDPLAQLTPVTDARTLSVFGDAAPYVAVHIGHGRTAHLPGPADNAWPAHDCAVLIGALEGRTDAEAVSLLRTALAAGPSLVLAERTADKAATDDHVAEYALTSLTISGSVLRTSDQVGELLRAAGALRVERATLGWGFGTNSTADYLARTGANSPR